jgi:chaperonin GroEL
MKKEILSKKEARSKIQVGVNKLADTVGATLGPAGRNVILEKSFGAPVSTKDGVSVAKEINLSDPFENIGAQLVKEAAAKTATDAGDGTTTATVLAQALYNKGLEALNQGANPVELKEGMEYATKQIVSKLKEIKTNVTTNTDIKNVATISANNDNSIGVLISTAMEKVGKDGVITVEESKTSETYLDIVEGMQFERGFVSPYFVTDQTTMQATLDDPYILLYGGKLNNVKELLPILEKVSASGGSLLIVCDDIADEALAMLIVNKARGTIRTVAVKAPEFGDRRIHVMEDLATITGGTYLSEQKMIKLSTVGLDKLGRAKTVTVTKDKTTIVDGRGDDTAIQNRIAEIKKQIDTASSDFDIEKLQSRLGKLSGGVAVLYIGAHTEVEMKEKKDRVDDALHATRAAVEEGIIPGGGVTLYNIARGLEFDNINMPKSKKIGASIVYEACKEPFNLICTNAGMVPYIVMHKIDNAMSDESKDTFLGDIGYDFRSNAVVDFMTAGIVDPVKVTRSALENAVSISSIMLTTDAVVSIIPETNKNNDASQMMY